MKKKLSKVLGVILCIVMMVGCASKEGSSSQNDEQVNQTNENEQINENKQDSEKVKIVWWTMSRHDMDFMNEKIAKFNEENPDIEIEYNVQTENYQQNLELAFQSGEAPDIFFLVNNAKYYVDREMIEPLDPYIDDEIKTRFGKILKVDLENYVDGKIYSLANKGVTFRLVYNKELFEKSNLPGPPQTLDELVEYSEKITEMGKEEGVYGYAMNLKNPYSALYRSFDQIASLSGISAYDYVEGQYDFEKVKPVLMSYKDMYANQSMFPGVESLDIDPLRSQFAEGKIGMYISGNWEVGVYANQFPTEIDWGAAPVPTVDGVKGTSEIEKAGRWMGISSQSEYKDEAWRVLEWFYSDEILSEYHENGLGFSVVPSIVEKSELPQIKGSSDFNLTDGLDGLWPLAPHKQGLVVEGMNMYDVYAAVIIGAMDIEEAINDLNFRYNDALKKAIESGKLNETIISDFDPSSF